PRPRGRERGHRDDSSPEPCEPARESGLGGEDRASARGLGRFLVTRTYAWAFEVHAGHVCAFREHAGLAPAGHIRTTTLPTRAPESKYACAAARSSNANTRSTTGTMRPSAK